MIVGKAVWGCVKRVRRNRVEREVENTNNTAVEFFGHVRFERDLKVVNL